MGKIFGKLAAFFIVSLMVLSVLMPFASAAVIKSFSYGPFMSAKGVIEADRYDFMYA